MARSPLVTAPDPEPGVSDPGPAAIEARELDRITDSLERAFPNVRIRVVQHAVQQAYRPFTDSPIRDFVPLLVERAAREDLIRRSGQRPTQLHGSPVLGADYAADGPVDPSM